VTVWTVQKQFLTLSGTIRIAIALQEIIREAGLQRKPTLQQAPPSYTGEKDGSHILHLRSMLGKGEGTVQQPEAEEKQAEPNEHEQHRTRATSYKEGCANYGETKEHITAVTCPREYANGLKV
jgi:hypothetical protein